MKKKIKIILSIILPIISILSICLPFVIDINKGVNKDKDKEIKNPTRYEANYFAQAGESSPAQGQSASYKGGSIFLENNSNFTMNGGTINNHTNTFGGAIFICEGATFTMRGGTISDCSATYGGAIYVASGGTCNILGGTISRNTANYGPSIYAESGATVNISSDVVIDANSVQIEVNVSISTDTIAVGKPSEGLNLHYVDFGSYPQTYVGNSMNTTLENWYSNNTPTAVNTYMVRTRTWVAYEYTDGNIYARGISLPYNTSLTYLNGQTIKSSGSAAWFKVEPIRWVVLNYEKYKSGSEDNLEILSYLALTADIQFDRTDPDGVAGTDDDPCLWVNRELRIWLNNTFYNSAFSKAEKELIIEALVKNNYMGTTGDGYGINTVDKVYCLSYSNYASSGVFSDTAAKRLCSPTDFALSNYCYKSSSTSSVTATYPSGGTCEQWTRTAGSEFKETLYISTTGQFIWHSQTGAGHGVRPALRLAV